MAAATLHPGRPELVGAELETGRAPMGDGGALTPQPALSAMGRVAAHVLLRSTRKRSAIREHGWHVRLQRDGGFLEHSFR